MVSQPASVVVLGKFAKLFKFKHIFKIIHSNSFGEPLFLLQKFIPMPNHAKNIGNMLPILLIGVGVGCAPKNGGCLLKSIYFWGIDEPNALLKGVQEVEIAIDLIAFVSGCFFFLWLDRPKINAPSKVGRVVFGWWVPFNLAEIVAKKSLRFFWILNEIWFISTGEQRHANFLFSQPHSHSHFH